MRNDLRFRQEPICIITHFLLWEVCMSRFIDMTDQRYGKLSVLERVVRPKESGTHWLCQCDCGTMTVVAGGHLRSGHTVSCGCHGKNVRRTHGGSNTRLYGIWAGMKNRCSDETSVNYRGRGITMCEEWNDFECFRKWAIENGYDAHAKQNECTIDRIDNSKGYSPDNCRWVNSKIQCRNKRNNKVLTFNGKSHPLVVWSEILGIKPNTLHKRIVYLGWSVEKAFTTPVG